MKNLEKISRLREASTSLTTTTTMYTENGCNNGHHHTLPATATTNIRRNNNTSSEINGNHVGNNNINNNTLDKFEIPLPFGYHMDLDFLRFCSDDRGTGETLDRLKHLRRMRRMERKNLEHLMGLRHERSLSGTRTLPNRQSSSLTIQHRPDLISTSEFVRDALKDAVTDFERCFEGTLRSNESTTLHSFDLLHATSSTPLGRSNTFPRHYAPSFSHEDSAKLFRPTSNSSISSISTSSSAMPTSPEAFLAGLPSSVPPKVDNLETDSIASINSDMSAATLRNVREQIARSLSKMREYEKQVEAIPVLQVKLSVLKEEKRLLMLKLKQRELQLKREAEVLVDEFDELVEDSDHDDIDGERREVRFMTDQDIRQRYENQRRARSESPYGARILTVNPEEFISVQRKRSTSCGYNSEDSESLSRDFSKRKAKLGGMARTGTHTNLSQSSFVSGQVALKPETRETAMNTDPPLSHEEPKVQESKVRKRDRSVNTDPPPKSPPPPRKINQGVNTTKPRSMFKSTGTTISMNDIFTRDEMEARIQEAVFKTEEDIMSCPLLQKAMAKVEEEALNPEALLDSPGEKDTTERACQVGEENLKPFVISVGLQCKLEGESPVCSDCLRHYTPSPRTSTTERFLEAVGAAPQPVITRTVGVGDCKVIEDSPRQAQYRDIGICTEKWVEVIKASKQTDTEDFAYKDTESPRVADMVFEPSPERVVLQRRSSLRKSSTSSTPSRKSSMAQKSSGTQTAAPSPTKAQGTMTETPKRKTFTKDAKVGGNVVLMKSVEVSTVPEVSRESHLCDNCNTCISVSSLTSPVSPGPQRIHAPPSPDFPWLSKIPRPIPENPDVQRLKSATSTGNLTIESGSPRSPALMQRSKSNLTPSLSRNVLSPKGSPLSPTLSRKDVGTPPPHPSGRRVSSPLTRSYSPYSSSPAPSTSGDKRSLIPKLSLGNVTGGRTSQASSGPVSPASAETRSLIPRVVTPPALRKLYPKPADGEDKLAMKDRNVVRKTTHTKASAGVSNPVLDSLTPSQTAQVQKQELGREPDSGDEGSKTDDERPKSSEKSKRISSSGFPLPGAALFTPIDENRTKATPSKEMKAALKVLKDSFSKGSRSSVQITNAVNIIQQEWFKTSSTKQSNPLNVEDYLDAIEEMSKELLDRVVNLTDVNGNTALHYAVSHGNFDVVSVLLDSKVANPNILNKAGYTCTMLISLAQIQNSTHRAVVARLFSLGDVNIRATQHGQTALMLAVSHGRLDMVQLLLEAGADVNIRDEDGSTALMCAAEHGHMEIVKYLLQNPDVDLHVKDNDGLTALAVAMEAGHRDIGVVLYANMSFSRGSSPYSSMKVKRPQSTASRGSTPTGKTPPPMSKSPIGPTPPLRTRRKSVDK